MSQTHKLLILRVFPPLFRINFTLFSSVFALFLCTFRAQLE
jgi:hypothetical protein